VRCRRTCSAKVFIVAQAIATGVFAELQYIGLRKSGETVTA
jgi:hypothetical protein